MPIISSIEYHISQKSLGISTGYWVSWLTYYVVSFTEEIINILVLQFGLPVYNIVLPSIIQQQINQQVMTIPVDLPYFNYYQEFLMDLSLTGNPAYVPDSVEFFALGDVYMKGSGGCQVPKLIDTT